MNDASSTFIREHWGSSFAVAFAGHTLLLLFLVLLPSFGSLPVHQDEPEVTMVRLRGGGDNVPGWVKPTTALADRSLEPDNKPLAKPKSEPKLEATKPRPSEPVQETPVAVPKEEVVVAPEEPVVETGSKVETNADAKATMPQDEEAGNAAVNEETGSGIGDKPGPEGPGMGVHSDGEFAGSDLFLSRVETEVQRRFNYRGRKTGKMVEYHFYIDKRGKMKDLLLVESSGIGSLDLAARSALLRAKFPPLPPSFKHDKLGVTYRFYDAD